MKQTILHEGPILIFDKSTEQGVGGCLGSLQDLHPRGGPAHMPSGIGVGEPSLWGGEVPSAWESGVCRGSSWLEAERELNSTWVRRQSLERSLEGDGGVGQNTRPAAWRAAFLDG